MRRCLHAFLIGLLTLSLPGGPAHACWRLRQRHCRPVVVVPSCPPPVWEACFDPCGTAVLAVVESCPAVTECCGEVVVTGPVDDVPAISVEAAATETTAPVAEPTPAADPAPTAVAATEQRQPILEPITPPPALEPAGDAVTPASNEQPMPEPGVAPVERSVVADPEMREAEPSEDDAFDAEPGEPTGPASADEPPPATPSADAPLAPSAEPVMTEEADAAATAAESAAAPPQPPVPEQVVSPPEPEASNIFEELDAADSGVEPADESEMTEDAADPFGEPADDEEPALDGEMADDEPAEAPSLADPADEEPAAPSEELADEDEAQMTEEDASPADDEPADPFAEEDAAGPAGEETDETPADGKPAVADPFAASEPLRRWIDATGAGAIVATLVDVGADGRCVLETRSRRIVVPVANLSRHDQDYVRRAGIRLATIRGEEAGDTAAARALAPTDTAGL